MDIKTLKTAYKYLAQLLAEAITELRKDKKDVIDTIDTLKSEVSKGTSSSKESSDKIHQKLSEALTELKDKNVTITNAGEINGDIVNGLNAIAEALSVEIKKLDKDIIINTDLEPLLHAVQKLDKQEKAEGTQVARALKDILNKIPVLKEKETVDYTLILDDIATALEVMGDKEVVIDLSKAEQSLADIYKVISEVKPFEIPERLLKDDRVKIDISDKQLKKMGSSLSVAAGGSSGYVKNTLGEQINPATEETLSVIATANTPYSINIQTDSGTSTISYIGKAATGTATSSALWQIQKLDETTGTIITYADGNDSFDNIWDDRESLSFS